jgi:hypothetical protein
MRAPDVGTRARVSAEPIPRLERWPGDPDRILETPLVRRTKQPPLREGRQSVGMSGTHPRALTDLRRSAEPGPAGARVPRPAHGLIPAGILNPPRGAENRAHGRGVAVPDVVGSIVWRADAQPRVLDDRINAVWRWMAPDHQRVIGVFGAGKAGVDDLEQVGHGDRTLRPRRPYPGTTAHRQPLSRTLAPSRIAMVPDSFRRPCLVARIAIARALPGPLLVVPRDSDDADRRPG